MKNNLRVAFLGGIALSDNPIYGGVQAATKYLIQSLSRFDDIEIHLLAFPSHTNTGSDYYSQNGVFLHLMARYPRFERLRMYRNYQDELRKVLKEINPSLLHVQEAGADAFAGLKSGYPTIVTAHGIRKEDAKFSSCWSQYFRQKFDSGVIEQQVMSHVSYLIANSIYLTNYFNHLFRSDIQIRYIHNAIDDSFFQLSDKSLNPIILYAGRVIPQKKVLDLIHAFSQISIQVPFAKLHIAGNYSSEPAYLNTIKKDMIQLGLVDKVILLGELDQKNLLEEYSICSLLVLPSAQENVPMVIAQAMAAGKPVVASRVGGVEEMLGKNGERGILFEVGDINGLAYSIIKLLKDEALRRNIGDRGRQFAGEFYHQDCVARQTIDMYRFVAERESKNFE